MLNLKRLRQDYFLYGLPPPDGFVWKMNVFILGPLLIIFALIAWMGWQSTIKPAPSEVLFQVQEVDLLRVTRGADGWVVTSRDHLHPVALRVGSTPAVMEQVYPLSPSNGGFVTGKTQFPAGRCFFEVTLQDGRSIPLVERHLPLEGAANFRDLGGYEAAGGRRVAYGRIFRSDELFRLNEMDEQLLNTLGLRTVVDLRNPDEVLKRPDRLPPGSTYVNLPVYLGDAISLKDILFFRHQMDSRFQHFYRETLVDRGAPALGALLRLAADPARLPLLFHCTAGKDRTGVAAMLLLSICGVPRRTIVADYTLSNLALEWSLETFRRNSSSNWSVPGLRLEQLLPLFSARGEILEGVYDHIEAKYGSMEDYLLGPVGLTPEEFQAIRSNLLVTS